MRVPTTRPRHRGHSIDATLAAVATLIAAWPVSTLLREPTWLGGAVLMLAVIALSGVAARSLGLRGWLVLMVQSGCLMLAASAVYGRDHLWHGLPTFASLGSAEGLMREAIATAQANAAPAPTTPGLMFVVGGALGLIALTVDYLAVTRHSPSLAGLPLLTVFLAVVANRGSSLPLMFFVAVAAMWLVLVARSGRALLRRWGTTVAVPHTPAQQGLVTRAVHDYGSLARILGVAALVTAVALPVVLPRPPPTFLASGLGRSPSVTSGDSGAVGFSLSLDLAADLKNRSRNEVLAYTTKDTSPPPLRIAVGSYYRPEPGVWLPWGRPSPALSSNPEVPEPAGLSPQVPKTPFVLHFQRNLLADPNLAVPYPLVNADLAGISWGADQQTQTIRVAQRPITYTASYWHLEPTAAMLQSAPALPDRDRRLFDLDLTLNGPYVGMVTALSEQLTAGVSSPYDRAMAIQQYLRADGGFSYSLTLAPPARNSSGTPAGFDPLTNFLATKRGYCVQFATAMVMMSRAAGIPARIAIGFLPGTRAKGVWSVLAADAHAWPELYLAGIGWTRFEPTPSRGAPPSYAIPATSPGTAADGTAPGSAATQAPTSPARKDVGDSSTGGNTADKGALSPISALQWLTHGWGPVLLGCLAGLLGSLVVPTAARWRRRRSLSRADTTAEQVEVRWELLTSSLGDLGIAPEPSRTPRQLRVYYDREAMLDGSASQALDRVVQTLEHTRYASSPTSLAGVSAEISADTRRILRSAGANRRGRDRVRAAFWPSSGVTQLLSARAQLSGRIRTSLSNVASITRRWLPGRDAGGDRPADPR